MRAVARCSRCEKRPRALEEIAQARGPSQSKAVVVEAVGVLAPIRKCRFC